jgi:hypothetical protein
MRIHSVPRGSMYPMPSLATGDKDKVLPGGLPPVPNRNIYSKLTAHHKTTHKHTQQWRDNRSHGNVATYVGAWAQAKLS